MRITQWLRAPFVASLILSVLFGPVGATPEATRFQVLERPAVVAPKATSAAMLAIGRAGDRLVSVGERGIVLLSDDSGSTWRQARSPVRTTLTAVLFVNSRSGWAVGHLGTVLHSNDGGESWTKQLDGFQAAALMRDYAKADTSSGQARMASFAKSLSDDGPDKPFLALHFSDERHGMVVGAYNLAVETNDGGATWHALSPRLPNPKGLHLYGIAAAGASVVIAGEQGVLMRSDNGGQDFTAVESPYAGSWFGAVATKDDGLLVYGLRGTVYGSTDRGKTWRKVETQLSAAISASVPLADGRLLLASQAGEVLESRDQGQSFQKLAVVPGFPIGDLRQASNGELVAAGLRGLRRIELSAKSASR